MKLYHIQFIAKSLLYHAIFNSSTWLLLFLTRYPQIARERSYCDNLTSEKSNIYKTLNKERERQKGLQLLLYSAHL